MNTKTLKPEIHLERYALGELPNGLSQTIEDDPEALARVSEIRADNERFLRDSPPEVAVVALRRRLAREVLGPLPGQDASGRARNWRPALLLLPALAAAAALLYTPAVEPDAHSKCAPDVPASAGCESSERIKGGGKNEGGLRIFRVVGKRAERLEDQATAKAGDVLQLQVVAGGDPYGMVLSIDGRGNVTPQTEGVIPLEGTVTLSHSYQLDDAPGFERFFLVTSNRQFSADTVIESAHRMFDGEPLSPGSRARELPLPLLGATYNQSSLLLQKSPRQEKP